MKRLLIATLMLALTATGTPGAAAPADRTLVVGSKAFTESHVLGEMAARLLEARGFPVERRLGLGGTLITFAALESGAIDVYPEYSGTLTRVVLKQPDLPPALLPGTLAGHGLFIAARPGFNNSYALAVPQALADRQQLRAISDLVGQPALRTSFSLEFLRREDGWPGLAAHYDLPQVPTGMEHALAYPALQAGQLDLTDVYTTDGELNRYEVRLLADDRGYFPRYDALLLARSDLPAEAKQALAALDGALDETQMRALNERVNGGRTSVEDAAASFLADHHLIDPDAAGVAPPGPLRRIATHTLTHLKLTGIALGLACLLAIPLSVAVSRLPRLAGAFTWLCGLFQTIPSLALLALLVPVLGLGALPAILALFLYSLLPIVRNTLAGLAAVDPLLKQVATGMGLTPRECLRHVELPLAAPTILAGVKTAAIISIGTATLAAFVGAGGLGEPIITGLTLNDHGMILEGAVPAALLAIAVELLFEALDRRLIPPQLRRQPTKSGQARDN